VRKLFIFLVSYINKDFFVYYIRMTEPETIDIYNILKEGDNNANVRADNMKEYALVYLYLVNNGKNAYDTITPDRPLNDVNSAVDFQNVITDLNARLEESANALMVFDIVKPTLMQVVGISVKLLQGDFDTKKSNLKKLVASVSSPRDQMHFNNHEKIIDSAVELNTTGDFVNILEAIKNNADPEMPPSPPPSSPRDQQPSIPETEPTQSTTNVFNLLQSGQGNIIDFETLRSFCYVFFAHTQKKCGSS
jgi:hypothetical protein